MEFRSVQAAQARGLIFRQHGVAERVQARRPSDNADLERQSAVQGSTPLIASKRLQARTRSCSGNRNSRSETPETHATATSAREDPKGAKIPHVKEETWSPAPHTLQYIGDQVHLYAPEVPQVVERECGPTRDPPQSVSIDIRLRIENDG
jgi:hypothetical protein